MSERPHGWPPELDEATAAAEGAASSSDRLVPLPAPGFLEVRLALALVARRVVELVQLGNDPAPVGMTTRDRMKRARKQVARQNEIAAELVALAGRLETL